MNNLSILVVMVIYFAILYLISVITSRKSSNNDAFFLGNRKSPWWVVAIAMVGSSISGVTFVSVPGWVRESDMTYMQMVFGFTVGYIVISFVLLPLYYRLNLTTIYSYLGQRFGRTSHKTGSAFFILSKLIGAAARLYLVAMILQVLVFAQWGVPFPVTVAGIIALMWIYTHKSGIKTIIWTDTLQTICLVTALILIICQIAIKLDFDAIETVKAVTTNEHYRIFVFDDWGSTQNFFKQFFNGIFITIVMTGLDQDMMQKNLTCKSLKDARKNMLTYGIAFIPINFLFLSLGILLLIFANTYQIDLPAISDQILPMLASDYLGFSVLIFFTIGIIAAAFSSADSAIASLTTSVCIDLLNIEKEDMGQAKKTRVKVHIIVSLVFGLVILLIDMLGEKSIISAIYKIASYTYGPLLGLFTFGLFTKIKVRDRLVPYICILSPVVSYLFEVYMKNIFNYSVGNEILMLNALVTIIGLLLIQKGRLKQQI
ncbi:sodium:solute symporter [Dysgonomonas sp. 216]|uniref:sodium:solute symporter n=1 Tax=Dysgonomonas sp. 216 TaxID=2302934 RepID=UPI0013D55B0A|nr:sodium:solute symporter [Dysgonomonas sp. 216]NDW18093.1 sodium:solute symporter [Dysgonomonas sp. 216]